MIVYLKRKDINIEKYDACIENAKQSRMYAFSWYLDIVAENWDALVLNDYEAVMPLPWKRKYFIKYVYPPFWLLQLGVFSIVENIDEDAFLQVVFNKFKFVELRMNTQNIFKAFSKNRISKQMQFLPLEEEYNGIFSNYRKDRKKDLQKAIKLGLTEKWHDSPKELITLYKKNIGKRVKKIKEKEYETLTNLIHKCIEKDLGEILSIYNHQYLVGSAFFLKHQKTITILVSSTDLENRKNGVNTYLIDRAIYKYQKEYDIFNFGGSSISSIASYFNSFGAKTEVYDLLKYNNLPFLLYLFKS